MAEKPMMACGHAANAVDGAGNPCCVICITTGGPDDLAAHVVAEPPDLTGRMAECTSGGHDISPAQAYKIGGVPRPHPVPVPSSTNLAFFEYRPDKETDLYYCGCWGWD